LCGSSEFHHEVYNLIQEIDIGCLELFFENDELEKEVMVESFVLGLTRTCKTLVMCLDYVIPEAQRKLYELMLCEASQFPYAPQ
ncbi:hypothetical protein PENTCL1PPCAC_603, partial [Pristionchus entomophagus]